MKTSRRLTMGELLWPSVTEFMGAVGRHVGNSSEHLLALIWLGFEQLEKEARGVDAELPLADLERNLTELLERRIRRAMTGFEPFDIQHGPYERETRKPAPAQPPQYDLAFILRANERIMWPMEAKVLPSAFRQYVADVKDEFLSCRYSPFSSEAAMLGYLLTGDEEDLFARIARGLGVTLDRHASFPERSIRHSDHRRIVPQGRSYPRQIRIHHLMLRFSLN